MAGRIGALRVIPEARALDRANDVLAAAQEGRRHLEVAHQAHCMDDWEQYLHAAGRVDLCLREIRDTARQWADDVTGAPKVSPNQLPLRLAA